MPAWLPSLAVALAALTLALGYAGSGWPGAPVAMALGLLWLVGQRQRWRRAADLAAIGLIGAAGLGTWAGLPVLAMLLGVVATLAAWDLDHFERQLRSVGRVVGERELARSHLWRLLIVAATGAALGALALLLRLELGFGAAILLGIIAVVGLSRALHMIRELESP